MILSTARRRRLAVLPTAAVALAAAGLSSVAGASSAAATTTPTPTSTVVISQVYGGGGNIGGVLANDFVELFNAGTGPVSVKGWSVQYAAGMGTSALGATVATRTALPDVTIQPGRYLLVRGSQGDQPGQPALPTPDVTSSNPIQLHESSGKVALVRSAASLGCNGGVALPCSPTQVALVADLVGYGVADFAEVAPTPQLTPRTGALRSTAGCVDTNNNVADFSLAAPQPRTSASPVKECDNVAQLKADAAAAAAAKAEAERVAAQAEADRLAAAQAEADRLALLEKAEADRLAAQQAAAEAEAKATAEAAAAAQAEAERLAAVQAAAEAAAAAAKDAAVKAAAEQAAQDAAAAAAAAQAEAERLAAEQADADAQAAAATDAAVKAAAEQAAQDAAVKAAADAAAAAKAAQDAATAEAARLAAEAAEQSAATLAAQQAAATAAAAEAAQRAAQLAATCRVLQPINCDGTSVFKLGSTVPVKFAAPAMASGATFTYHRTSTTQLGTQSEATATLTPTTGGVYKLDGTSGQHHFNWSTKGLQTGTYLLTINGTEAGAAVTYTALVTLR